MRSRILAALGVGLWCFFLLVVSLVMIVDRGLAGVGVAWFGVFGLGAIAPFLLLWQVNRVIATHETRGTIPDERAKEKELLAALEERRELTPAGAAMRTSLTVEEASKMLEELARRGHLDPLAHDGMAAYALAESGNQPPGDGVTALPEAGPGGDGGSRPLEDPLSERELEVLALLASGRTNSEVARDLFVSVGTVKSHTGNIYRKLGARNRTEALARARGLGVLP